MFPVNFRLFYGKIQVFSGILKKFSSCCSFPNRELLFLSIKNQNLSPHELKFQFPSLLRRCQHSADPKVNDCYEKINISSITNGDKELEKKLKVLFLEVEVMRHDGEKVPSQISESKWKELLSLPGRMQRIKLLSFWWRNEILRKKDKIKKEEAKKKREALIQETKERDEEGTDHMKYGFKGSTIFIRIYDSAIDNQLNSKLINAMMFGEKLIIDCSYDEHMTLKEASLCAKQLTYIFAENRSHNDPFDVHFCNANPNSRVIQKLEKMIPTLYDPTFPLNISSKHYLDLFPKKKLVYLTPHCREDLQNYSPDDIYIIGAMVDKANNEALSLAKAKSEGLRMAKFPLDRYLDWSIGTKSLTLDQVLKIMLDLKDTRNWVYALRHVPRRKLKSDTHSALLQG